MMKVGGCSSGSPGSGAGDGAASAGTRRQLRRHAHDRRAGLAWSARLLRSKENLFQQLEDGVGGPAQRTPARRLQERLRGEGTRAGMGRNAQGERLNRLL
jgi:hypothetical protein